MATLHHPARFTPKEHVLASAQLFAGVPTPLVHSFAAASERLVLGRGDKLWVPGDAATHFHLVAFGAVKLQRLRADSPVILAYFLPGESVADALVVARDKMPACAVAQSAVVEVIRVPAEPVLAAQKRVPVLADALHAAVARQVRWLHTKIEIVTMGCVQERLATFVLRHVERLQLPERQQSVVLPFAPSRVELASTIESRPETVTRALGKFARDRVFTVGRSTIEVHDIRALRGLVPHEGSASNDTPSSMRDASDVA